MSQYQHEHHDAILNEMGFDDDRERYETELNAEFDRLAYESDMAAFREDDGPWPTKEEMAEYEAEYGGVEHAA